MLLLFAASVPYCGFYAVTTTISSLFAEVYPFLNETEIGLCYLGLGAGGALSTITVGRLLDIQFKATRKKVERAAQSDPEKLQKIAHIDSGNYDDFAIEEACLKTQFLWICTFAVACIGYGWVIHAKASIAISLVLHIIRTLLYVLFCLVNRALNSFDPQ